MPRLTRTTSRDPQAGRAPRERTWGDWERLSARGQASEEHALAAARRPALEGQEAAAPAPTGRPRLTIVPHDAA